MTNFSAPPLDEIRIGFIGLGSRGPGAVWRLSHIADVKIAALCDLFEDRVERVQGTIERQGRPRAKGFFGGEDAWKELCEQDLDLVYIATPWRLHTPMAVRAMERGKHAASEVPALNMTRQGVLGEIVHAEGAYIHDLLRSNFRKDGYQGMWRLIQNRDRNGSLYPTHGVGPVAQCLNINRGDRFEYLASLSSADFMMGPRSRELARQDGFYKPFVSDSYRGQINVTVLRTAQGKSVMIQHDVTSPRPYSRIHLLSGTKGIVQKWPVRKVSFGHEWLEDGERDELLARYRHPLMKKLGRSARKIGGHGGMDFVMDYRLMYCLKNGLPLDQSVYDAAAWSAVAPLSEASVADKSSSVEFPDFTSGHWRKTKPLGIVDVELGKLPMAT
jgi:hypothetical protein